MQGCEEGREKREAEKREKRGDRGRGQGQGGVGMKGGKGGGEGKERWKQKGTRKGGEVQGCEEGRTGEGGGGGKGKRERDQKVGLGWSPAGWAERASHPSHVLPRGVTLPLSCHVSLALTAASGGTPRPIIAHSRPIYFHTTAPSRALRSSFVCDDNTSRGKRGQRRPRDPNAF